MIVFPPIYSEAVHIFIPLFNPLNSETLNVSIFQYVLVLQTKFFDNLSTDKEDKMNWSKRWETDADY